MYLQKNNAAFPDGREYIQNERCFSRESVNNKSPLSIQTKNWDVKGALATLRTEK